MNEDVAGEYLVLSFAPNIFRIKDIVKYKKAIICIVSKL